MAFDLTRCSFNFVVDIAYYLILVAAALLVVKANLMSGAVRGSEVDALWSNDALGPSPIIRSARSSVVSLDGRVSDSDAQGARATLARIRDLVNRSLDMYGGNDDDNCADLSSLLDTSSASATLRREDDVGVSGATSAAVTALNRQPTIPTILPPPLPRSERVALAPRAASVFSSSAPTQLISTNMNQSDHSAPSLFALRQGISRALSLLPSVGDFARMEDTSRQTSSLFQNSSFTNLRSSTLLTFPTVQALTHTREVEVRHQNPYIRSAESSHGVLQAQNSLFNNESGENTNTLENSIRLGLSRDADISRLEDRVELLFVQVRDAARRAREAAADATEALRKTADMKVSKSSLPHRRLKTDWREGGGRGITDDADNLSSALALDASEAAVTWLAGGGEGEGGDEIAVVSSL